jgi:formyl-CoA transferase/succinyl-CoA--D-citramalate CoA-transferase
MAGYRPMSAASPDDRPALDGVRVLELGSFIAGPFAGQLLGDLGADVVKVEPPGSGDPMRRWGVLEEGRSLWWPAIARNKRSVAVDLRDERGRNTVRRLAARVDVVLENFKPGTLERFGLGYDALAVANPAVVLVHVSGFGQTGPRAHEPGFGAIGEAVGGIRYTTGDADRPPARAGISLGDSLAALFAVIGTLTALHERSRSGRGQEVDVAIAEAVFALMESTVADYELGGVVRTRSGGLLKGVAPSNAYPTADGHDVVIAANADAVFVRLCDAMGRPELATDPRYAEHEARGARQLELDDEVARWTSSLPAAELLAVLERHSVPSGLIHAAPDLASDPQLAARDMVLRLAAGFDRPVPMAGVVPKLSRTPGTVRTVGPALGEHTDEVLRDVAGLTHEEITTLRAANVIA